MGKKRGSVALWLYACVAISLSVLTSAPARADEAAAKESCVTSSCHPTMGTAKFVHGPVAVGECTSCHKKLDKHKFAPIADAGKQCEECHEKLTTMKVVHKPVKEGKCTSCHDPHQSANKFQLRAAGSELCFTCHPRSIAAGKYLHGPMGVGQCNACHTMHQSEFPKLLIAEGNGLCFTCHSDTADEFNSKKFMHTAVKMACVGCHSPHSSDFKYTLKAEPTRDLCFSCHDDKEKEVTAATVPHKALTGERGCLACHNAHVSNFPKQLYKQPMDLCLSCHNKEYHGQNGNLANISSLLSSNAVHHGPIQEKDCSGCHNAHGSTNFRMLRESFPQLFYAPYSQDNYKLCFMCHQKSVVSEETTTTLTGFRNGDQNLHFVHVNKAVKGRTCRACHDAHATNNPKHVRNAVPFAKWQLPIGFKKTETGGACLPGCHQLFRYDRNKAVVNKPVDGK